ncbi:MAG: hypothetical protein AAFX80_00600 [Cyanobacteria bacterium J06639_18]
MYDLSIYLIVFSSMNHLTESDQIVLISIVLGFSSGIVFGLIDNILEYLIKDDKINFINSIRQCVYLGITMAIFFGVTTFVEISIEPTSIQTLNRTNIEIAIIFGLFAPIFSKISNFLFSQKQS